ncbi:MAG TPA: BON domain-containing protein, partial [Candidatus Binatia bacterium]|nr:BON domain-containing protein [Candidatus Binatia bacterium]
EARKVSGVKRVLDELQVVPAGVEKGVTERDSQIENEAEQAMARDRALKDADIRVEVRDGVARLKGTVPSENERLAAIARVKRVDGVRRIQDDLKVQKD